MRVSQSFGGTREHGQFQLGNSGTKAKCLREQGNEKHFREHGTKHSFAPGGQKKWEKKRRNRHLSCDIFFFFSICFHGAAAAVELGYEYML